MFVAFWDYFFICASMNRHCTLLANGFDGGVQFLLGICAISSLYIKRQRECPQRPLQVTKRIVTIFATNLFRFGRWMHPSKD